MFDFSSQDFFSSFLSLLLPTSWASLSAVLPYHLPSTLSFIHNVPNPRVRGHFCQAGYGISSCSDFVAPGCSEINVTFWRSFCGSVSCGSRCRMGWTCGLWSNAHESCGLVLPELVNKGIIQPFFLPLFLPLLAHASTPQVFVHYLCPELLLGQFHLLHCCWFTGPCKLWWNPAPVCRGSPTTSLSLRRPSLSVNYLLFVVYCSYYCAFNFGMEDKTVSDTLNFFLFFFSSSTSSSFFFDHHSFSVCVIRLLPFIICNTSGCLFSERKKKGSDWLFVLRGGSIDFITFFPRSLHLSIKSFFFTVSASFLITSPFSDARVTSNLTDFFFFFFVLNKITWRDWTTQVK